MTLFNFKTTLSLLVLALTAGKVVKAGGPLLSPNNALYRGHCEKEAGDSGSDPRWPCFTFYEGDLKSAGIELLSYPNAELNSMFAVKDDAQKDFTITAPTIPFRLKWHDRLVLTYSAYADGCFDILLESSINYGGQLWVSDDTGKDRDIDAWNWSSTGKRLCTKWVHIYVKKGRT